MCPKSVDLLKLEFQAVVSCLVCALGIKLISSARTMYTLKC